MWKLSNCYGVLWRSECTTHSLPTAVDLLLCLNSTFCCQDQGGACKKPPLSIWISSMFGRMFLGHTRNPYTTDCWVALHYVCGLHPFELGQQFTPEQFLRKNIKTDGCTSLLNSSRSHSLLITILESVGDGVVVLVSAADGDGEGSRVHFVVEASLAEGRDRQLVAVHGEGQVLIDYLPWQPTQS